MRRWGLLCGLWGLGALAHPAGFHKRLTLTVSRDAVVVLAVMDVDQGPRCSLLRAGADADGDGSLSKAEAAALAERLVGMMLRTLTVDVAGYALPLSPHQTKLTLRDDRSTSETGLSVGALLELPLPSPVIAGMPLTVADTSPDLSPVALEVFQDALTPVPPVQVELENGRPKVVRLAPLRPPSDAGLP